MIMLWIAAAVQIAAPQVPAVMDWRAVPVAAGVWSWRPIAGGSEAVFQSSLGVELTLRCNRTARTVSVIRSGASASLPLTVRTTNLERALALGGTLPASDRMFDSIAFSRGRFAVEGGGRPRLVIPAWPEAARSSEDCRL